MEIMIINGGTSYQEIKKETIDYLFLLYYPRLKKDLRKIGYTMRKTGLQVSAFGMDIFM